MNRLSRKARREAIERKHLAEWPVTGWELPLLQDASKELSYWLSERIDSRMHAREASEQIREKR